MFPTGDDASGNRVHPVSSPLTSSPYGTESLIALAYETLRQPLIHYFTHAIGEDEAEDLLHDLFASLLARPPTATPIESLDHYIWRAAHYRANTTQRNRRIHNRIRPYILTEPPAWTPDPSPNPCDQLITTERTAALHAAIDNLRPALAATARIRATTDATLAEIAATLGISHANARQRSHRALTILRTHQELRP